MKNKWKGNQKHNEDITQATILTLDSPFDIIIHKEDNSWRGHGIFLSCNTINYDRVCLYTDDWEMAEKKAINIIKQEITKLYNSLSQLN